MAHRRAEPNDCRGAPSCSKAARPLAGALVACIAALFLALLGWLAWAQVDEVVHAAGTVEPAGRVKIVNHPRGGRVAAIHVREGQRVEAGAVLVTLDGEVARSERSELAGPPAAAQGRGGAAGGRGRGPPLPGRGVAGAARPIWWRRSRRCSRPATPPWPAAGRRWRRRSRPARASCARPRPRSAACATAWSCSSSSGRRCRSWPSAASIPSSRWSRSSASSATIWVSSPRPRRRSTPRGGAGRGRSRLEGLETDRRSTCWAELAQATADRDRLAEQLRAQEAILAGSS